MFVMYVLLQSISIYKLYHVYQSFIIKAKSKLAKVHRI